MIFNTPAISDLQSLDSLKQGARQQSPEAIKQVAKQFEGLFVQMLLKSMRSTVPESELFSGKSEKMYQEMYDKQLSMRIANGRGIGLAKSIERQLGGKVEEDVATKPLESYLQQPRAALPLDKNQVSLFSYYNPSDDGGAQQESANAEDEADSSSSENWQTANDFINDIWSHAHRAAQTLGVDTDVLIAQSALETGWGKYVPLNGDGSTSFNLFGIKADQRWQGSSVEITTREYRHGVMQQEKAAFRAYDSVSQAFEDYTDFILSNPRYQQALEHGYDGEAYARELQKAGYATDPNYAEKINRVRRNEALQSQLKNMKKVPLT